MKQHITMEQWEELDHEQHLEWDSIFDTQNLANDQMGMLPSIGQMIEFLGDDLKLIARAEQPLRHSVVLREPTAFITEELCDALWEAVKLKLRDSK